MKTTRPPKYTPAEWAMMRNYYTEEEKAEVKGGGKKKKEEPKSKDLRFLHQPKHGRCRCPEPREFGLCFGTDGVESIGGTIGDCERTCQRSKRPRMGNVWLSSIGSG